MAGDRLRELNGPLQAIQLWGRFHEKRFGHLAGYPVLSVLLNPPHGTDFDKILHHPKIIPSKSPVKWTSPPLKPHPTPVAPPRFKWTSAPVWLRPTPPPTALQGPRCIRNPNFEMDKLPSRPGWKF